MLHAARRASIAFVLFFSLLGTAYAELENVQIGGELRLRGRNWIDTYANGMNGPAAVRYPAFFLPNRAIGATGTNSRFDRSDEGNDLAYIEQRTVLHIKADYTSGVSAVVDFEAFHLWGRDFRSNYITGADGANTLTDNVQLFDAYIDVNQLGGYPLELRIGRQTLKLGKGWLVSDILSACVGLSFDAVRLTYSTDQWDVDAWWSKLAENSPAEQDGDVDYAGVNVIYKGWKPLTLSVYGLLIRDARSVNDTNGAWNTELLEDIFKLDNYDATNLYTLGLRANGKSGPVDYDLELASQFGNAGQAGSGFKLYGYGDDNAKYNAWAGDLEVGYTFDARFSPRVFAGGAYFSGEDNRDVSFFQWLLPFRRPQASLSFNRLFSGIGYAWTLESGQELSNFNQIRAGFETHPFDKVSTYFCLAHFGVNDPFDAPRAVNIGRFRVPVAPSLSFWTQENSKDLGWMTYTWVRYDYSDSTSLRVGWERMFTADGLAEGSFLPRNGLEFGGGTAKQNSDYLFFELTTKF